MRFVPLLGGTGLSDGCLLEMRHLRACYRRWALVTTFSAVLAIRQKDMLAGEAPHTAVLSGHLSALNGPLPLSCRLRDPNPVPPRREVRSTAWIDRWRGP